MSANPDRNKEVVFVFRIDNETNTTCRARALLGLNAEQRICDCVFYYSRESIPRKVLCLVELKKGAAGKAVEQIITTHKQLKLLINRAGITRPCTTCGLPIEVVWKAYIRQQGASPVDVARYKPALEAAFGKGNFQIKCEDNITKFLRKGIAE